MAARVLGADLAGAGNAGVRTDDLSSLGAQLLNQVARAVVARVDDDELDGGMERRQEPGNVADFVTGWDDDAHLGQVALHPTPSTAPF